MLRRPILARVFPMMAIVAIVAIPAVTGGLPLLASGADVTQAVPRHGTGDSRQGQEKAAPAPVTMQGRVVDYFESGKAVPGATLEFVKGPNAGRYAVADGRGYFSFSDLTPSVGGNVLRISHPSYKTGNFEPSVWFNKPVQNFDPRLTPLEVPQRVVTAMLTSTDTFRGSISSSQAACDMPDQDYPCEKFRLSSASGKTSLSAELTWTAADIDLDFILYDGNRPIARSVSSGSKKDVLSARISGSGPFEIRVIASSRRGTASFTLDVKRTN